MAVSKFTKSVSDKAVQDKINEIIDNLGGTSTDVQVNGTSITSNGVANLVTNTAYNASSNKIATMSDLPASEVFVAIYETTTFADVLAAYNAGKNLVCQYTYMYDTFVLNLMYVDSNSNNEITRFVFQTASGLQTMTRTIDSTEGWSSSTTYLQKSSDRVTSLSSSSTNAQYPSAKCVYDELALKYDASNPNGYTSNVGTVTSVNSTSPDSNGNVSISIPDAQVQSNWNETNTSSKAYIQNKPTIPTVPTNVSAFTNDAGYVTTDHTYPFNGITFYSTDGTTSSITRDCNQILNNGLFYYTSNGPSGLGEQSTDGALYVQAYSTSWVVQIAQDYRTGNIFTRSRNNGTWMPWKAVGGSAITIDYSGV